MAVLTPIPTDEAITALRTVAGQLRAGHLTAMTPEVVRNREELAAAVLEDLASNIPMVSRLLRTENGAVLIETAEICAAEDVPWADTGRWYSNDEQ